MKIVTAVTTVAAVSAVSTLAARLPLPRENPTSCTVQKPPPPPTGQPLGWNSVLKVTTEADFQGTCEWVWMADKVCTDLEDTLADKVMSIDGANLWCEFYTEACKVNNVYSSASPLSGGLLINDGNVPSPIYNLTKVDNGEWVGKLKSFWCDQSSDSSPFTYGR